MIACVILFYFYFHSVLSCPVLFCSVRRWPPHCPVFDARASYVRAHAHNLFPSLRSSDRFFRRSSFTLGGACFARVCRLVLVYLVWFLLFTLCFFHLRLLYQGLSPARLGAAVLSARLRRVFPPSLSPRLVSRVRWSLWGFGCCLALARRCSPHIGVYCTSTVECPMCHYVVPHRRRCRRCTAVLMYLCTYVPSLG